MPPQEVRNVEYMEVTMNVDRFGGAGAWDAYVEQSRESVLRAIDDGELTCPCENGEQCPWNAGVVWCRDCEEFVDPDDVDVADCMGLR